MGFEIELFVHPERISSQLICPICTSVLERPVQTPSEHLFCEDELLEWMTRSQMCPVTNTKLDPDTIKKPGRIIVNMLAELEMYCPNRIHGCQWIGSSDQVTIHKKKCSSRSKEELLLEIQNKDSIIAKLKQKLSTSLETIAELQEKNTSLLDNYQQLEIINRRLKVYDAFFKSDEKEDKEDKEEGDDDDKATTGSSSSSSSSAVQRLSRLRRLHLIEEKMDDIKSTSSRAPSKLVEILSGADDDNDNNDDNDSKG